MKKEMYVTPEMEVMEFRQEIYTDSVLASNGTSTQTGTPGEITDIGSANWDQERRKER